MVKQAWNRPVFSGNPMVIWKNKMKYLKGEIKSWRSSHNSVEVSEDRRIMVE